MSEIEVWNLDYDEELLSHLVNSDSWIVIQGEGVDPSLIEDEGIREIFLWQRNFQRLHGELATPSVLAEEFELNFTSSQMAIGDLLDRMRSRYMRNQGRATLEQIVTTHRDEPLDVPQMLLRKGRELTALLTKKGEMFGTGDFPRAMQRYEKKRQQGPGASFGYPLLNEYFYGMRGLTIWLAPPKTMKSWNIIQGTFDNVVAGRCTWVYSLELPAEESDMRLRHLAANVPWWRYIHSKLDMDDKRKLKKASEWLDDCGIYKIVKPERGHRGIDEMVHIARDAGAEVIFIDQLQYVENEKGNSIGEMNVTGEYWGVLDRARDLSDEGPICFAHQFNRSAMYATEMPRVEQAKGSSAIEETATLCLGIWGTGDMRKIGLLEVGTLVARNAAYASWDMNFDLHDGCTFDVTQKENNEDTSDNDKKSD